MDWSFGNVMQIALRAVTHRNEIERVTRRTVDLLFELERVHADLLDVIRKVAPDLLADHQRMLDARRSSEGGRELH